MSLFVDNKQLLGCMYGSAQVRRDFPRFVHLVETGRLDIGSMVSRHIAPRRRERRLPGHGGGRGHPQRHRLTRAPLRAGQNPRNRTVRNPKCLTLDGRGTRIRA